MRIFTLGSMFLLCLGLAANAQAVTVYCANCSEMWTQQIERVTSLEQLQQLMGTYHEAIQQTQQQIELVRNNIQQYQNMVKNTLSLPSDLLNQVKGEFSLLAQLTNQLKALKGDVLATGEIFDDIYPDLDLLKNLAGGLEGLKVEEIWENWSRETDRAARATFQLTGSQLQDIAENSEALDQHIGNLLSTPEGQMQAIQSGNSLAAIQIDELRQLRALMATSIQAVTQFFMKDEKQEQAAMETQKNFFKTDGFKSQYQGY